MDPDRIFPGQRLTIPGAAPDKTPDKKRQAKPEKRPASYVVQPGDTLKAIAATFGVSLTELLAANTQLPDPDLVHPGVSLNIPG